MEEICNKEKELKALVHVTNVLYERSNEMQQKLEEQQQEIESYNMEK